METEERSFRSTPKTKVLSHKQNWTARVIGGFYVNDKWDFGFLVFEMADMDRKRKGRERGPGK